ncbi:MAG: hypothetical protein IJ131_00260, partial [Eggerthellaceae bacterium]|nr:hypothetical protein [Eggerthellaceae bacterium]
MFKRSRDEERTELDAAWDDENAAAGLRGSDYVEESDASEAPFPKPHDFNLTSDSVPANASERDEATGVPFDADDSFAYDAESEEFTSGDASGFLDDSHTDFYSYGQKKHGVHDAPENADAAGSETSAAVVGGQGRHGSGRSSKRS